MIGKRDTYGALDGARQQAASSASNASYTPVATSETAQSLLRDGVAAQHGGFLQSVSHTIASLSLAQKVALGVIAVSVVAGGVVASRPRAPAATTDVCGWAAYRLPGGVEPLSYTVTWAPDFGEPFMINGRTTVDVEVTGGSSWPCLLLHAANLTFTSVTVQTLQAGGAIGAVAVGATGSSNSGSAGGAWWQGQGQGYLRADGPVQTITSWSYDEANERVVLRLPSPAVVGARLRLDMNFTTPLGRTNTGLYLSTYKADDGSTVNMVATQFEATYARHAFPCFDEPALKANFTVVLDNLPNTYTALGNMPVASTGPSQAYPGKTVTAFQPTPRMSTYLVAAVAGPLIKLTNATVGSGGIPMSVYAVSKAGNEYKLAYALQAGSEILPYYESLFNLPFPLPKMDMVAIPDFAAGAMENWGLITYRETALLSNVTTSSAAELQRVAVVVSHELAHQWFGDITTMDWWNALWLNEGFARRTEYIGVEMLDPSYGISRQFQSSAILSAMRADAYATVQALTQPVGSSQDIEAMFSSISYDKGGSLLWMLQHWLAVQEAAGTVQPNAYFRGVSAYLAAHKFGNAAPSDLWAAFAAAAGIPALSTWMSGYELVPGYAVVALEWADQASALTGSGVLTVTQKRHFQSPYSAGKASPSAASLLYWIPLTLTGQTMSAGSPVKVAADAAVAQLGFTGSSWSNTIGTAGQPYSLSTHGWVKANVDAASYYRVAYPANIWAALGAAAAAQVRADPASTTPFTPFDRAQLLDDLFSFAQTTQYKGSGVNTTAAMAFASNLLPVERSYEVWLPALSNLGAANSYLITKDVPLAQAGQPAANPYSDPADLACANSFRAFARSLLGPTVAALGWTAAPEDTPLTIQLRSSILAAASVYGEQSVVDTARSYWDNRTTTPIPVNVASLVLSSVVRWGGAIEYNAVKALYEASTDAAEQRRYLAAMAAARDRTLLQSTLEYAMSPAVRTGDKVSVIAGVAGNPLGRDLAWAYVTRTDGIWAKLDELFGNGGFDLTTLVSSLGSPWTSAEYLNDVTAFWDPAGPHPIPGAAIPFVQAQEAVGAHMAWAADRADTCAWLTGNYPSS